MNNEVIGQLERWTASGASWRVAVRTQDSVTINLITCTGGEVAEKITSSDPELLAWLGTRGSSESAR